MAEKPKSEARPAFPAEGGIRYNTYWNTVAYANLPQPTPDLDIVAQEFRDWAKQKGFPLNGKNIIQTFEGFCHRKRAQR